MDTSPLIQASGLVKIYRGAGLEHVALQGLDLEVASGEWVALVGPSGAGKSTLLRMLAGLERPSAGRLQVAGLDLLRASARELTVYRASQVGVVWQQTAVNVLPYLSARANVALVLSLAGARPADARRRADELLETVGLAPHAGRRPAQLSGGQQQRAALACALARRPAILLGDELTGELDWASAEQLLDLLSEIRARHGLTVLVVTHDQRVAGRADRVIEIRTGRTSVEAVQSPAPAGLERQRDTPQALALLDRAGRLQLSDEQRVGAGLGRRVRVEQVEGGLLIRPGDAGEDPLGTEASAPFDPATLYADEPAGRPQRWRWWGGGERG